MNYTFEADLSNFDAGVTVYLNDEYTGSQVELQNGINYFNFSVDTAIPESSSMTRFNFSFDVETFGTIEELVHSFSVYPNPVTNQKFTIQAGQLSGELVSFQLADMSGKVIMQSELKIGENGIAEIKTGYLPSGVFIIELTKGKHSFKEKIIIK
jgi:hypothetical protein